MSQIANISGPLTEHQSHTAFCIIQNYTNGDFNIVLTNYQTGMNHLRFCKSCCDDFFVLETWEGFGFQFAIKANFDLKLVKFSLRFSVLFM